MAGDEFVHIDHIFRWNRHSPLDPSHQDESEALGIIICDSSWRQPGKLPGLTYMVRDEIICNGLRHQVLNDTLKGILSLRPRNMTVEFLILQDCREDKSDSLPLHVIAEQDPYRSQDLFPADPFQ